MSVCVSSRSVYSQGATVASPQWLLSALAARAGDYLVLTKPRIVVMVLVAAAVGYSVGCQGEFSVRLLIHALLGIGAVAAGCSVLNQWWERGSDGLMRRTARRPLPAGRVAPGEALTLGVVLAGGGFVWLWGIVNALTAALTLATLVAYVGVYTPLKRRSSLCTAVGAIPGAAPPVLGWTAAGGSLDLAALSLFAIVYLWQFPHFLAIAWLYRDDYAQAGLRMLPHDGEGRIVGRLALTYAVVLLPLSLLPRVCGLAGDGYFWSALVLGLGYLLASAAFAWEESRGTARRLLWTSLIYLPAVLASLSLDHWRLLF
jgi:protoheme IX farnesyltransferase